MLGTIDGMGRREARPFTPLPAARPRSEETADSLHDILVDYLMTASLIIGMNLAYFSYLATAAK